MSDRAKRDPAQSRELFLRAAGEIRAHRPDLYDLETEFARTRGNRNLLFPAMVIAFLLAVVAFTILFSLRIEQTRAQVAINISDFEDANLRELLDTARRHDNQLELAQLERQRLDEELARRIARLRSDEAQRIAVARETIRDSAALDARIAQIQSEQRASIAALETEYEPLLAVEDEKIADLQIEIAQYDQRLREQEEVVANQLRLAELQMQERVDAYDEQIARLNELHEEELAEVRAGQEELIAAIEQTHAEELEAQFQLYNPSFDDPDLLAAIDVVGAAELIQPTFEPQVTTLGAASVAELSQLATALDAIAALLDRLAEIPYENSPPQATAAIRSYVAALNDRYSLIARRLSQAIAARNRRIGELERREAEFRHAFDALTSSERETGFVVDGRDAQAIAVYLNDLYPVAAGDTAFVFRDDDEYIGRLTFFQDGDRLRGRLTDNSAGAVPLPFDKILIQVEQDD